MKKINKKNHPDYKQLNLTLHKEQIPVIKEYAKLIGTDPSSLVSFFITAIDKIPEFYDFMDEFCHNSEWKLREQPHILNNRQKPKLIANFNHFKQQHERVRCIAQ